jgi:cellulose synthase (UDP-forming)
VANPAETGRLSYRFSWRVISRQRAFFLGLCAAGLLLHLIWRVDQSLDGLTSTGLTLSVILLVIEGFMALALITAAVSEFMSPWIKVEPVGVPDFELPSIDVFVLVSDPRQAPKATYTLAVASQLDYPRQLVNLHLVGHGKAVTNAAALLALSERTGATWIPTSHDIPAGTAMNAAIARTGGSLMLFLQAGDAPTPDLLQRVAGAFDANASLAFCDIPTFSIDGDPMLTDIDVTQRLPNDPGPYFKSCLKAPAGAPSPLGIGMKTVWLRAALSSCGSMTRTNCRPDAVARIRAAERKWNRGIVDRPMVAVIAPDTVRDHLQARLAQRIGTIDAALIRDPVFGRGLSMRERLSWVPALTACILPFAWTLKILIPAIAVLTSVPLISGDTAVGSIAVSVAGIVLALMMSGALFSGIRTPVIATWSEMLESFLSIPALVHMVRGRENPEGTPRIERANGLLILSFALLLAGTTMGVGSLGLAGPIEIPLATPAVLTIIMAFLFACVIGAIAEPRQRRLAPRINRRLQAELLLGGETFFGRLADISVHGARFIADELVDLPARALAGIITLDSPTGRTTLPVQLSRHVETGGRSAFGLSFTGRTVGEFATVVRLAHRSGDSYADICDARARPIGILRMSPSLALRGIFTFVRSIFQLRRTTSR